MKKSGSARGQTLVLFALTSLLLTLLVLMTLSISTRVKEKMELQAVADAAAYSNAVITARAYNEIALMSRAQIGKMVSMAAVQSLISWSSYYVAQVQATLLNYEALLGMYEPIQAACCAASTVCGYLCACATAAVTQIGITITTLTTYQTALMAAYTSADASAGTQSRMIQMAASAIYGFQVERWIKLRDKLGGQELTREIMDQARAGSRTPNEWEAPGDVGDVGQGEAVGLLSGAALVNNVGNNQHHVYAAMGSRGHSFVTSRNMGAETITMMLRTRAPGDLITATNLGSAYFAAIPNHGGLWPRSVASWADDHGPGGGPGTNTVLFSRAQPPCVPFTSSLPTGAMLHSTDANDNSDFHFAYPSLLPPEPPQVHTLGMCVDCPGIWPFFVDYNPYHLTVNGRDNNWGQPKNHAAIVRDYSRRNPPDPWALFFNFDFTGSSPQEFDGRGIKLSPQNGDQNISRQVALSTGIAYYHRYGHWQEPPNLLNPYWRATLVPWDVDEDGEEDDTSESLDSAGAGWAKDAFEALRDRGGYKGGP